MSFFLKKNSGVYVIAEAGLNHNGDLDLALEIIEIAQRAGADAVKFQKRTIDLLAVKEVLDAEDLRFPFLGSTYREIREKLEFTLPQYIELKKHTESLNMDFIVTPFDEEAVKFLRPLNLKGYKVASHSLRNLDFLHRLARENKPIVMSTGMSTLQEIDEAVGVLSSYKIPFALLHCVSSYPTNDFDANLNVITTLQRRYQVPIGYSGHEMDDFATKLAVSMGAKIIERHVTVSRSLPGFDHKLSLEEHELRKLIDDINRILVIQGSHEKTLLDSELVARNKYNVSMVSRNSKRKGERLLLEDIVWKNPGTGIGRIQRDNYIGKRLLMDVPKDSLFLPEMFE